MTTSWSPALYAQRQRGERMDLGEWLARDEDARGELVAGRLVEEEVPDPIHELAVGWLIALLRGWLAGTSAFVFASGAKLALADDHGRKPDVCVYLPGSSTPPRRGPLRMPPDIAIEVVSASPQDERRDRVDKMSEYATFGIAYYWIVDPALGSLEIFALVDGVYARVVAATSGAIGQVPGCNGLVVDLDALWAELARLSDEEP